MRGAFICLWLLLVHPAVGEARTFEAETIGTHTVRCEAPNLATAKLDQSESITCVVQTTGGEGQPENVSPALSGIARNVVGHPQPIEFRMLTKNDAVTYLGTFERASTEPVRIFVTVDLGDGSDARTIELREVPDSN